MATKPLTHLAPALRGAGYADAPNYRTLYHRSLDGVIPVEQSDKGRWFFDPADLHVIAEALGLTRETEAA